MELRWPSWFSRRRGGRLSQLNPSAFQNSTLAELAWQRARNASTRWAIWGAVVGVLVGLVLFAPASWLAYALSRATDQRLLLADAQGTVWNGSAQVVLTGGIGQPGCVSAAGSHAVADPPAPQRPGAAPEPGLLPGPRAARAGAPRPEPLPDHPAGAAAGARPMAGVVARRPGHAVQHHAARRGADASPATA